MSDISIGERRYHGKASEEYVSVLFKYGRKKIEWDIPIEYPKTGTHLSQSTDDEIEEYVAEVYEKCHPDNWTEWRSQQKDFWSRRKSEVTKEFFDVLSTDFTWKSSKIDLPSNDNYARRISTLKEFGYTIATKRDNYSSQSSKKCNHLQLLPLPRGGITGYEQWTPEVRDRIMTLLRLFDAYEGKAGRKEALLPDHKFPEARWDSKVKRDDLSILTDEEILNDFQLLTNQRNLHKREVCRTCVQTGNRGYPFGIQYFYEGGPNWNSKIPTRGVEAREGCIGCGWYDFETWRNSLNSEI